MNTVWIALALSGLLSASIAATASSSVVPAPVSVNPPVSHTSASPQWIPVPSWLAGTWWAKSEVVLYSYNYSTRQSVTTEPLTLTISRVSTIGMQKDGQGTIWHYTGLPYNRITQTDSYTEFHEIESTELQRSDALEVRVTMRARVTRTAKENSQLIDSFSELTTISYVPLPEDGLIQASFLIRDFDMQGRPMYLTRAVSIEKRIKPFAIVDLNERGNLRLKFNEFMTGR